jgi:hypothetical protein
LRGTDFEKQRRLTFPPFASMSAPGAKKRARQSAGGWAGAHPAGRRGQMIA